MPSRRAVLACALATGATWVGATSAVSLPAFTTTPKRVVAPSSTPQANLVSIRVGRHGAFDRVVFRWRTSTPGYDVRYVPQVTSDGSGDPVALRGRRFIQIAFTPTVNGTSVAAPSTITPLFPTLRQIKVAGDFEGVLSYGLGLSKRNGFRVFTLTNPRRTVIDVAH